MPDPVNIENLIVKSTETSVLMTSQVAGTRRPFGAAIKLCTKYRIVPCMAMTVRMTMVLLHDAARSDPRRGDEPVIQISGL